MFKVALRDRRRIETGVDMYRSLFPVLVALSAVHCAPKDHNSEITYVKIQPLDGDAPNAQPSSRESRIEILPLSIRGGNLASDRGDNYPNFSQTTKSDNQATTTSSDQDESTAIVEEVLNPAIEALNASIINKLNRIASEDPLRTNTETFRIQNHPESTPQERTARSDITAGDETTETTELTTQTEEVESSPQTTVHESRTKTTPPRYISKLSYFKKSDLSGSDVNLVERGIKKRFRSRCRCEKIWNCPKLQISVPRCPNEYFLCCF